MKYAPKTIKKVLKRCIKEMSLHPEQYCVNPGKDFTRVRKLSFEHVLEAVLSMSGKTLRGELMEHFNLSPSMPTVSAFVQQKNKVDHRAFEALFLTFTNAVDEQHLFKGYRLLAVGGSDLHTHTNREEKRKFYEGSNVQKPYNLIHLNALYDIQRRIYIDAIVQASKCINEHKAFITMVDRDDSTVPTIYIADRGYESYNNMAHVIENGQNYLIRARDLRKHGIAAGIILPSKDEFDTTISLGLTRQQTKQVNNSNLRFIAHTSTFDYLPANSRRSIGMQPYYHSFRIV